MEVELNNIPNNNNTNQVQVEDPIQILRRELSELSEIQIKNRVRAFESEIGNNKSEITRIRREIKNLEFKDKDIKEKIKLNTQLPHLIATLAEVFDVEDVDDSGGKNVKKEKTPGFQGKAAIVKTSTRSTIFLPIPGIVDITKIKPMDLIAVNKDTFLIYNKLPAEYDSRVKSMELDEKPQEKWNDIGGLDKQVEELIEAVVLPIERKDLFDNLGIKPPKGVLMYGPPGTGKTLLARACARETKATFLKLAGSQLVQMYIGDGAKMVRDAFALAKEKAPTIIFIDEIDSIGVKRSGESSSREVQRTMLELLNQLDGFSSNENIKVIAATNRVDVLDPALMRSGRLDRKIEFPHPNEKARANILEIHARKMNYDKECKLFYLLFIFIFRC
jgi:26S proteasome regulatory subunit T5